MTTFKLADLVKPVARQEVQASIYDALGILGINTAAWKPGGVPRVIIAAVSVMFAGFSELVSLTAKGGFLELAEGDWLTIVAHYVYAVDRQEATFASGFVTLNNTGGGDYGLDPGDLIVRNPTTGATYRNLEPVTLAAGKLGVRVAIAATEPGHASTSNAGEITELTTPLLGVECTNDSAVVGQDTETDPALRARCSEKLGVLSPMGPWDAYSSAVRNATRPDGSSLGVTRIRTTKDGYGNVTTYVATASGEVPGDDDDPATDLGIANEAIQKWAAPFAVTAHTMTATPLPIPIVYELWMYNTSGRTDDEIRTTIASRLTAFMSSQPIGGNVSNTPPGKVYHDAIRATIAAAYSQIFHVDVLEPGGDLTVGDTQVAVMDGEPSGTRHQVSPLTAAA